MSGIANIDRPTAGAPQGATGRAGNNRADGNRTEQEASVSVTRRPERLIRLPEVKQRTGLSRSSIYLKIAAGQFPPQVRLGIRMVAWYESQVDAWVAEPR